MYVYVSVTGRSCFAVKYFYALCSQLCATCVLRDCFVIYCSSVMDNESIVWFLPRIIYRVALFILEWY